MKVAQRREGEEADRAGEAGLELHVGEGRLLLLREEVGKDSLGQMKQRHNNNNNVTFCSGKRSAKTAGTNMVVQRTLGVTKRPQHERRDADGGIVTSTGNDVANNDDDGSALRALKGPSHAPRPTPYMMYSPTRAAQELPSRRTCVRGTNR